MVAPAYSQANLVAAVSRNGAGGDMCVMMMLMSVRWWLTVQHHYSSESLILMEVVDLVILAAPIAQIHQVVGAAIATMDFQAQSSKCTQSMAGNQVGRAIAASISMSAKLI